MEDWLRAAGVAVPADITESAYAVNADGSVVVGSLANNHAFIARVAAAGSGLVTLDDLSASLAGAARGGAMALGAAGLAIHGAHGRPLSRRVAPGQKTWWLAGDWGGDEHGERAGDLGLAEIGLGRNFGAAQLNVSLGRTRAKQALGLGGTASAGGVYVLAEELIPVQGNLWAAVGGYLHRGEADMKRGYLNAGAQDYSSGAPGTDTRGLRARLEWERAWRAAGTDFTPYAEASRDEARLGAYTETGGGFPARFNARKDKATELRLGVNAAKPVADNLNLVGLIEAAHRFEKNGAPTSGQVIGLFGFELAGQQNKRDWARVGVGVEGALAGGHASVMLNATTQGPAPSAWLAASWQRTF